MRLDNNKNVWLSLDDLRQLDMYNAYKKWLLRGVEGIIIVGEGHGKEVLYDSIPQRSRKVSKEELIASIAKEEATKQTIQSSTQEGKVLAKLQAILDGGYGGWLPKYEDKTTPREEAVQLAKAAAILEAIVEMVNNKSLKRAEIAKLWADALSNHDLKYANWGKSEKCNEERASWYLCYILIPKALKEGVQSIVKRKNVRNNNAAICTPWHLYAMRRLYALPTKYTKQQVYDMIDWIISDCEYENIGIKRVSLSTVVHKIDRQMENELWLYRYGRKSFNDFQRGYIVRNGALFPGDLWMIDGTRIQRMYEEENKVQFAYSVRVVDAYSRAVIGEFTTKGSGESRYAVATALKIAAKITGYLPAELLSDNSTAVKNAEMDGLFERLGIKVRHSKVGNAKDKTIENVLGVMQTRCDKLYDNNFGEGVKSKRKWAHPSPEHIERVRKLKGIPKFEGLVLQNAEEINIYNNKEWDGKTSCISKLRKTESPSAVKLNSWEIAELFWLKREETVHNALIRMKVLKEERVYRIWAHENVAKLNGGKVWVRYDYQDKEVIYVFDHKTDELVCEAKLELKANMAQINQTDTDKHIIMSRENQFNAYEAYLESINEKAKIEGETFLLHQIAAHNDGDITEAEQELALIAPFTNVRNTSKRFKTELNSAEAMLMTRTILDEHDINEYTAKEGLPQNIDMKAVTPLEEGFVKKETKKGKKAAKKNIFEEEGDLSEI